MRGTDKKPQILFCIIAGIGLFFPLIKAEDIVSLNFIEGDGKLILYLLIANVILLLIRSKKEKVIFKIISLILIIIASAIFFYDTKNLSKIADAIPVFKYGIGYYLTLVGLVLSLIVCVIDLFNDKKNYYTSDFIKTDNNIVNQPINNVINQPINNQVKDMTINHMENSYNSMRLSDLVNHNNGESNNKE